jgi:DNA-directed RNA polymerase subunit RPC12/RpoP
MANINWQNLHNNGSRTYVCGHCGNSIASQLGYYGTSGSTRVATIYICHQCNKPTFFYQDIQVPGAQFGQAVKHIPDANVEKLYDEARTCFSVNAFTSSVMCCRKLLMNIAVSEGATEGLSFVEYVNYLNDNNFIPPKGKAWVDAIRKLGNEANHSIEFKNPDEARLIITFTEMLLKFIYEMPGLLGSTPMP